MKQVVNAKNFVQTLDLLRDQVKAALGGYREQVYGFMAKAWLIVLLLRRDKELQRKFIRRAKLKVAAKGTAALKVVTEVMAYVMGVKTESGRKLAWKRGRVIEFLHDQGIKISKIAAEIQSRGGIEAVLKQAAKQKPRRDKVSSDTKNGVKKRETVVGESNHKQDHDESDGVNARSPATARRNDGWVVMPMLINLSDRDMLLGLPLRSCASIIVTRVGQKDAKIEVDRIKELKVGIRKVKDNDDW
jgi:hypothetical protein